MREVLAAQLGAVRLASVLQLAEAEMLTARVVVEGVGEIALREGRVVGASCGADRGTTAVFELFLVGDGALRVGLDPDLHGEPLGTLLGLILEGCRLADEWERLAPLYLAPAGRLPDDVPPALRRLDGRRSVADAAAGQTRVRLVDPLLALCESGALVEVAAPAGGSRTGRAPTPAPVAARAAIPSDYFGAMDVARRHLRDGRWTEAEAAFLVALGARPGDRVATQNLRRVRQALAGEGSSNAYTWFRRG